jgi:hypothetical protein
MTTTPPSIDTLSSSGKDLARGSLLALVIAGLVLLLAVLPAEYGIDPTGVGKAVGLNKLHSTASDPAAATPTIKNTPPSTLPSTLPRTLPSSPASAPNSPAPGASTVAAPGEVRAQTIAAKQITPMRHDTQEITLPPGKGVEVKTHLAKGASLMYSWKTKQGALINHDFHGEPVNAKEEVFESFIEEKNVNHSNGVLIAPFTGVHGWYWENNTAAPVTVVLHASGFYSDIFKKK